MSIYEQGLMENGECDFYLLGKCSPKFILVTAPTTINATEPCFGITLLIPVQHLLQSPC